MAEFSAPYPALAHPASQDPRVKSLTKGRGQSVALEQAHPFLNIVTQQLFIDQVLRTGKEKMSEYSIIME